jgi:hypothetical protein
MENMKTIITVARFLALALAGAGFGSLVSAADSGTNAAPERIGIFDSRVIAYAEFWTPAHQSRNNELVKQAQAAKAAGETERFAKLEAELKSEQEKNHLQVFSTASVDNVLAGMKERVAAVQQEAKVSRLVSKWDEVSLKELKRAEKVDVTDLLLREFTLNEKQQKVAADLRKKDPLPLKRAEELLREGKL